MVNLEQAIDAAKILGKFFAKSGIVTSTPKKNQYSSGIALSEEAQVIFRRILHEAYPKAIPGEPDSSSGEAKRINLASAIRNFFMAVVNHKNSNYSPEMILEKKEQRKLDCKEGVKNLDAADARAVVNLTKIQYGLQFDLLTNLGKVTLETRTKILEPLDKRIIDPKHFREVFGRSLYAYPEDSFGCRRNYGFDSAKNITVRLFLKAFTHMQTHIDNYKEQGPIKGHFRQFKENVDLIVEGLQNFVASGSKV